MHKDRHNASKPRAPIPCSSDEMLDRIRQVLSEKSARQCSFFRSCRYFTVGHEWYAATREGLDIGPFIDRPNAELKLAEHLVENSTAVSEKMRELDLVIDQETTEFRILLHEFWTCRVEACYRSENSFYAWAKRRIEQLEEDASGFTFADARVRALRHRLAEMDKDHDGGRPNRSTSPPPIPGR